MRHALSLSRLCSFAAIWALLSVMGVLVADDLDPDEIKSLNVSVNVQRTGQIEIEQEFVLSLGKDGNIKRGPILSYLTAYRGFGNLVLDHKMRVEEVLRDGKPEPFKVEDYSGMRRIVCGESEVLLEPGEHRYLIRFSRNADWVYRDGMAHWAYEITEPFNSFPIENLTFQLQLPDDVDLDYYTLGLSGSLSAGTGYETVEIPGGLQIQTTAPLRAQAYMFVNASWKSHSFATQSQWFEIMKQHPKLPITGFLAIVLFSSLIILLVRIVKNHQVQPVPSA